MFTLPLFLVAGGLFTLSMGAPIEQRTTSSYTVYSGDGDTSVGWPTESDWISSFDTMFDNQNSVLKASCTQFGVDNNSDDEISDLKSAISEVAETTGIDSRFILAIVMQESNGCVRAPTTVYSISNPGLMQSHEGSGSCNSGSSVQNPCPKSEMVQMITDGTAGTSSGDGLAQCLKESAATDVSKYYKAARIYNSGSIDSSGNLGDGVATHCYATDVANRLTGWFTGTSSCDSATIGSLTGGAASAGSSAVSSVVSVASSVVSSVLSEATSILSVPTSAYAVPTYVSIGGIFAQAGTSSSSSSVVATVTSAVSVPTAASSSYSSSSITAAITSAVATSAIPIPIIASSNSTSALTTSIPTPSLPATVTTATISPTSSIAITYPSASSSSSNSTTHTPGTECATSGTWNCIDGTTFQQCSSGTWSSVGGLAAGTQCTVGEGDIINIFATNSERKRSLGVGAERRGMRHTHMHGFKRNVL
ncbi:putative exo-beta glucanase protein [Botrytis fragariae]|uniref:Putative exo-beta glucanase protein n=1 Tax=Botrytis fragariae TaxID=1964551 RepID=A0A8H6EGS7_9HELO|nr:putative exo-beta glucanase protein [Botrytis fragariae]KAF5871350.1 putative exo-beta glucanase protein [Botrytis fragariae]